MASLMDENLFFWRDKGSNRVRAMVTTHVDDCGCAGKQEWLDEHYNKLCAKFGKVTRQLLPFDHCAVTYARTKDGYSMSQDEFCRKLKPAAVETSRQDNLKHLMK